MLDRLPASCRRFRSGSSGLWMLQAEKAVQIAAHSHVIEFGLLAILFLLFNPMFFLSERWKRIWVRTMLLAAQSSFRFLYCWN